MNVLELSNLCKWYTKNIIEPGLVKKYQNLQATINRNNQPGQEKKVLREPKEILYRTLNQMKLDELNNTQLEKLADLEIDLYIGKNGVDFIEKSFKDNIHDSRAVANDIGVVVTLLNKINTYVTSIGSSVDIFVKNERIDTDFLNQLRVVYKLGVSIENVEDLKKRTDDLFKILRGFSMIYDENTSIFKLASVENGSTVFNFIVGSSIIIPTIVKTIKAILEVSILNYERKKKILEIEKLELDITSAEESFEKIQNEALQSIFESVLREIDIEVSNENANGLKISIETLSHLISKGGEIEMLNFMSEEDQNDSEEVIKLIKEVRRLYRKEQKQLNDVNNPSTSKDEKKPN